MANAPTNCREKDLQEEKLGTVRDPPLIHKEKQPYSQEAKGSPSVEGYVLAAGTRWWLG